MNFHPQIHKELQPCTKSFFSIEFCDFILAGMQVSEHNYRYGFSPIIVCETLQR